jgi:aspartyl-tRNA(Asn)/glutamyl-tRNA(Gln) amidotransferase subunit A
VVGKTNVPEFTLEGYTDNALFGATRNPWNTDLTPGGSSGGAAASVAAGCTPLALGTDGGGSIRRPAAHCGLVGFKPSLGAIARTDGLPALLLDFEVVGLMSRSVADIKAMFTAAGGAHQADTSSLAAQAARSRPTACHPLRVLYVASLDNSPVDPEIASQCEHAVQQLVILGHEVQVGDLPLDLAPVNADWPMVSQIGLDLMFAEHPEWGDAASAKYRDMARRGAERPSRELWRTLERVAQLRRDCVTLFAQWDVIVTPTTAAMPWPAREAYPTQIANQDVGPRGHAVFTGWVNAAGLPGVSLPIGQSGAGLPIGLHLVTRYGGDDLLLNLASVCETQLGWHAGWPEI